ncbi:uncharacterized protein ACJ7VT_000290 [Polymixia lowei]
MDQFEERLAEEVRRYKHLYDPSSEYYKHVETTTRSWKEIGETLGEDSLTCMKRWKATRDRFVRLKKKMKTKTRSDDRGPGPCGHKVPAYYDTLSWLHEYVKHRDFTVNVVESADSTTLSSPDEHNPDVPMATPLFVISTPFSSPAPAVMCSDDEGTSTGGLSSFTAPSPSKPAKKRKRGHDILETIDDLRREQVVNCTALISHINTLTQDRDEHMTFALAIADSLRKLPKERVEATKLKLFSVLSEAHMQ